MESDRDPAVRGSFASSVVDIFCPISSMLLIAAATNDMYAGFGSRTPGAVVLQNAKVALPLVR